MEYQNFQQEWVDAIPNKPKPVNAQGQIVPSNPFGEDEGKVMLYFTITVCRGCGFLKRTYESTDFIKANHPNATVLQGRLKDLKEAHE